MIHSKTTEPLSFCYAVKYATNQSCRYDYSDSPRPCHNFVFMLEGEGTIKTDNSVFGVKKGDILFIPKNSTYIAQWKATPNCVYHSVHFKFTPSNDRFYGKKITPQRFKVTDFESLYASVETIQSYQYSKNFDFYAYLSAFYQLCSLLFPLVRFNEQSEPKNSVAPAIAYLENNHTEPCTVEKLASLCFLSSSRFFYLFKKQTGLSPIAYKNMFSIQEAALALLLNERKSIEEIAYEYGFESPIYFRRLFKKLTGKTPSQYRKEESLL